MAVDSDGRSAALPFLCRRERPDRDGGPSMIRQKISQAEVDLYFDMLAGLDWHPMFLVLLVIDDGDQAIERARATLISVCSQGYPDWHVAIIGDNSAVALCDRLVDGCEDVRTLRDRLLNRR